MFCHTAGFPARPRRGLTRPRRCQMSCCYSPHRFLFTQLTATIREAYSVSGEKQPPNSSVLWGCSSHVPRGKCFGALSSPIATFPHALQSSGFRHGRQRFQSNSHDPALREQRGWKAWSSRVCKRFLLEKLITGNIYVAAARVMHCQLADHFSHCTCLRGGFVSECQGGAQAFSSSQRWGDTGYAWGFSTDSPFPCTGCSQRETLWPAAPTAQNKEAPRGSSSPVAVCSLIPDEGNAHRESLGPNPQENEVGFEPGALPGFPSSAPLPGLGALLFLLLLPCQRRTEQRRKSTMVLVPLQSFLACCLLLLSCHSSFWILFFAAALRSSQRCLASLQPPPARSGPSRLGTSEAFTLGFRCPVSNTGMPSLGYAPGPGGRKGKGHKICGWETQSHVTYVSVAAAPELLASQTSGPESCESKTPARGIRTCSPLPLWHVPSAASDCAGQRVLSPNHAPCLHYSGTDTRPD